MEKKKTIDAKKWHSKYKSNNYNPKLIFTDSNSKVTALFSLSFFIMIMASEILFNQPFGKKIKIIHNNFFKNILKKKYEKIERVETNSFGYSLLLILQKLLREEDSLKKNIEEIILYVTQHWSTVLKLDEKEYNERFKIILSIWNKNKDIVFSIHNDSIIDLIFLLYKSFELGIGNKKIIKKNIAVLIFSVSKANREFRYDVLKEFREKKIK